MNTFDLVLILTILISLAYGTMRGFLGSITGLPLVISSVYLSSLMTTIFKSWLDAYEAKAEIKSWAFLILVLLFIIGFRVIAGLLRLCLEKVDQQWIDQFFGFLWGLVRSLAILKLIAWLLTYANMTRLLNESIIIKWLQPLIGLSFGLKFW